MTKEELAEALKPILTDIRTRRRAAEEVWLNAHAAWSGRRRVAGYHSDRMNYFIPLSRRSIERATIRAVKMMLPGARFFTVMPGNPLDEVLSTAADNVQMFMLYLLTRKIGIRRIINELVRSFLLYARAIIKTTIKQVGPEIWPSARVVDPFCFYTYPEVASNPEEWVLVFEDSMLSWEQYASYVQIGVSDAIDRRQLIPVVWPQSLVERSSHVGLYGPSSKIAVMEGQGEDFVQLTEVWALEGTTWKQLWLIWNLQEGARAVRMQEFYKLPPYRMASARPLPNEAFQPGMMQDLQDLQLLLNDQFTRGEDANTPAGQPPLIIDPMYQARADRFKWGAREIWWADPNGVKMLEVPDTSQAIHRALQLTIGLMQSVGGPGPQAEGITQRNMPRSGQAISSLIGLQMMEITDVAETLEMDVLSPTLGDLYDLALMAIPKNKLIRLPGSRDLSARTITREKLQGSWLFEWLGSAQTLELQERAGRFTGMVDLLTKTESSLQTQGYQINWPTIVKLLWREVVREPGMDEVIKAIQVPMDANRPG